MSENKEEKNSSPADIKEEEKSLKTEENKVMDESSKDSDKDSDKDSTKEGSVKEESEKGSEKDESEEDEDEEMGLLDRPVEVTGCRARKKIERLELSFTTTKEKQHEIPEGKGDKLGDCPRIEYQIQRTKINELKPLHRILFSRVGSGPEIKKNIRKFSGFTFVKNSQEYDRKKASIEKFTISVLKRICEKLDIERRGTKEEIVNRLLEFLIHPKDSGKSIPKKKQSKEKKKAAQKKTNSKKPKAKTEVSSDEEPNSENESASEEASDGDEQSESEPPKKSKNSSKAKKTPVKTVAKKPEKKEKAKKEKKVSAKGAKRKREDESSDSSTEEPSAKKNKMPTDDEIKKLVKSILDAADLQEITMKKVIKQVSDTYPDFDLSHKKAFIKSTIKSVIS